MIPRTTRPGSAVALVLLLAALVVVLAEPKPVRDAVAELERELLLGVNAVRDYHGLPPLEADPLLDDLARDFSRQMVEEDFFAHRDPAGVTLAERLRSVGVGYRQAGENLARHRGVTDPVTASLEGWLASEQHRANLLAQDYSQTGVGVWQQGPWIYVTQIFLQPPE